MANATVGVLRVLLTANAAEYESVLKRASDSAKAFAKQTKDIGQQLSSVGASLTKGLTLPLVGIAGAAIKAGLDFDKSMNQIKGVLQPTAAQMDQVRATALKMGADTVFSATDAANAMLELGKAGFDTSKAMDSVDEVLQLAAASGLSMADAASLSARALNAFGLESKDLGHVNDVLAKAVNTTSLEIADLQIGFQYIGPIARGFGMSIESASAALGIMRDSGIAAETAGRALREGLGRLANPVKSVRDVLGDLGIALQDVDPSMHSLAEIVGTLQAKGLTAAQSLKLFGDAAGPGMFALVQKGQAALVDLTKGLENSGGAAKKMADAMMEGLPGAIEQLRGSIETALIAIKDAIEPAVILLADKAKQIADAITNTIVPAFKAMSPEARAATLAILGIAAAAGPTIYVLGQLALAVSNITALFKEGAIGATMFGTAVKGLAFLTTPIGLVATAIVGLSVVWAQFTGDWTRAFDILIPPIGLLRTSMDLLRRSLEPHLQLITDLAHIVRDLFVLAWQEAKRELGEVAAAAMRLGSSALSTLKGWIDQLVPSIRDGLVGAFQVVLPLLRPFASSLLLIVGAIEKLKSISETAKGGIHGLANDLDRAAGISKPLANTMVAPWAPLPGVVGRAGAAIAGATTQLHRNAEASEEAAKKAKDAAEAFEKLKDSLSGKDQFAEVAQLVKAIEAIGGATKITADQQKKALDTLNEAIDAYESLGQVAPAAWQSLRDELGRMPELLLRIKLNKIDAGEAIQDLSQQLLMWRDFRINTKLLIPTISAAAGGLDLSQVWEPFKKGIKDSREGVHALGDSIRANILDTLNSVPQTLARAFEGGGDLSGAFKSIGIQIASAITEPILKGLSKIQQAAVSAGATAATALGGGLGGGLGATVSSIAAGLGGAAIAASAWGASMAAAGVLGGLAIGAATLGIGAAAVGVFMLARHFFTVGAEVKKARENLVTFQGQLDKLLTDEQRAQSGGQAWAATLIQVRDSYIAVGLSAAEAERRAEALTAQLLNTDNPAGSAAAMAAIGQLVGMIAQARATSASLFDQIVEASSHGVPNAMRPVIEQLIQLGLLTDAQIKKLRGLMDGSEIDVDQLKSDLDSIGGRLESLGPSFQQADIDKTAAKYINSIDRMIKAGGDVGGILFDAKEEVSDLVNQSRKFGTTLPANMKPWIDELARAGLLLDENGQKITDTSNIKFGEPIKSEAEIAKEGWDAILTAIQELITAIRGPLTDAVNHIPTRRTIEVDVTYNDPGRDDGDGGRDRGHAVGTLGRYGSFFHNFGRGMSTTLHGMEAVITRSQAVPFAMNVLDSMVSRLPQIPSFNVGYGLQGLDLATSGGANTTSSVSVLPIFMGTAGLSSYEAAKVTARYLADSGLATDSQGITTALEKVIAQWHRTYGGDR